MKQIAYMVEWSDDQIFWENGSIHWYLSDAIRSAEEIPYSWRIRKIEINSLDLVTEEEYQEAREQNKIFEKLFKTLQ